MSEPNEPTPSTADPLDALLAEYVQQVEGGAVPDREALLARHPELAERLRAFFADFDRLDRQAADLKLSADAATLAPGSAAPPLPLGTLRYFGDYELLEEIARGGMGVVYRARQVSLNRPVALKMILAGQLASAEDVRRFRTEAEAAGNLDHPNIVPIYEVGEHEGQHYFSMKVIDGASLAQQLRRFAKDPREAARLLAAVARAVHHAHQRGILHRDLKPGNILVGRRGEPHVSDFGLARRTEGAGQTQSGAVVGTAEYMAPEQAAASKGLTTAVDTYALGAVLYAMLTGRPPFQSATTLDTLLQVLERDPVPPRALNPQAPRDLEVICLKCLSKEPGKRYPSAEALAEDLERWLRGEPIAARPAGQGERLWRWCRRNPAVAALTAAVAAALLLGAAVATVLAIHARAKAKEAYSEARRADEEAEEAGKQWARAEREAKEAKRLAGAEQKARERAEIARHGFQMTAALRAWQQHDVAGAEAILDEVPPAFQRTWEYRHVRSLCRRKAMPLKGHMDGVLRVAYSPDGRHIVSGSADATLKVWDAATGQGLLTLKGHTFLVTSVAYSPDGRRIVSGSWDKKLKVWNAGTGQDLLTLKGHRNSVSSVAYSPDGRRIVSGSEDQTLKVWDAATGRDLLTLKGHQDGVNSVGYSPDGRRIVSGSMDKTLKVWDAATGRDLLTLKGHQDGVCDVAYSPDGRRIVSGSFDGTLKVWDAGTGQALLTLKGHGNGVTSVAYSPDGRRIVSGSGDPTGSHYRTLKVWDASTGQNLLSLKGHSTFVTSVAYSPDGRRIVSGSHDRTLKVWDAGTGQDLLTLKGHTNRVNSVGYSPDGRRIASGSGDDTGRGDHTLKVWDGGTGQALLTFKGHSASVASVAYSPDGRRIVSGSADHTLKVWDGGTGQALLTFKGHSAWVASVAYSPDGRRIVSGSHDHTLKVWDAGTGEDLLTLKGHKDTVSSVAYSPDGRRIVSGCVDGTLKVWDAGTGQDLLTLKGDNGGVTSVAYSPDGRRIISGSQDRTPKVWDAGTGQVLLTLKGHTNWVNCVGYSPNGRRIISGSKDQTLKVWDAGTGQDLLTLKGHTDEVLSVAYSPDGRRIVSGGADNTLKVWDAGTDQALLTLKGHRNSVSSVAFSTDGKRIFGRDKRGKVLAWDAASGKSLTDAPATIPDGNGAAVHGDRRAYIDKGLVRVERIFPPDEQERFRWQEEHLQFLASREFHADEAEAAEDARQPLAAVFHLDRLLPLLPGDRTRLLARRRAILAAALKQSPGDLWAARALARQALTDPATVADSATLRAALAALAKQPEAPRDRLHGALLLRTGSAREALAVLRAARKQRGPDAPPVEELLLALAHAKLKQLAAARTHLEAAVAWMRQGGEPVRAAGLLGLAVRGPLTALASQAVPPPDPRLEPLDRQTAQELTALRAEAEKALTAKR
jgi:WD40 repeat protein